MDDGLYTMCTSWHDGMIVYARYLVSGEHTATNVSASFVSTLTMASFCRISALHLKYRAVSSTVSEDRISIVFIPVLHTFFLTTLQHTCSFIT